jgi:serine protease
MNKKIIQLVLMCFLFSCNLIAQTTDFYYTFNNNKVNLTKISGKYLAEFTNEIVSTNNTNPWIKLTEKTYIVAQTQSLNSFNSTYYLTPTYITSDGQELNYTREILLKFKTSTSTNSKNSLISLNNLTLIKSTPSYEMYEVNGDALQISKIIYLSGQVEFCTPNFIAKFEKFDHIPNDPYFNNQWYLHNTGQGTNDGKSTTIDADIDAPEAWDITLGSPNVTIAIVDEGVTSNHPDLPNTRQVRLNGSNFAYLYDGTNNPNDPSPTVSTTDGNNHGNACAGIVSATQDNNEGITGIAPLCKIMPIKLPLGISTPINLYADAINFASDNNADIISNSWGINNSNPDLFPVIISAINYAITNNKLVVFSAGNTANHISGNNGYVGFPANANITNLITVGASDRNNNQANYSPNGQTMVIVAPSHSAYNIQIPGESFNIWSIDIPDARFGYNSWRDDTFDDFPPLGELLPNSGTNFTSYSGRMGGTSAAAPEIAGVLALMKSINSCLTAPQLKNILQLTADKIGGFNYNWNSSLLGHSIELGYGKVNAFRAVQMAQLLNSPSLDLMVKDGIDDVGSEPNNITPYMWASTDIWIRNQPDGIQIQDHQNPEYSATVPNYAYVRVTNKSCVASTGNEQLKFYWAKAGTSLSWPNTWDGTSIFTNGALQGSPASPVPSTTIPALNPGQEIILQIPFFVPNPNDYISVNAEPWHFCLLARIEAVNDPSNETNGLYANVQNNNNIAWKNVTIVDVVPNIVEGGNGGTIGGVISVGNPFNEPHAFFLELIKEDLETGKPIYDEAEVSIKMDEILYGAWTRGGKVAQLLGATIDEKKQIVKGNNVIIDNILFNANEMGTLNLKFNFLTEQLTEKSKFLYHVIQKDAQTGKIIGGETYVIKKQARPTFIADAGGDKEVDINQTITISAEDINEPAIYNWYDINGNLVFTGKNLTISTDVAKKYQLEVIATLDGFKDYAEVNINFKPSTLGIIAPNPASSIANISYNLNNVTSAYLMVLGSYGISGTSNNYILDVNSTTTNIDLSNYQNGFYTVALVCNGTIVDAKILIKQ